MTAPYALGIDYGTESVRVGLFTLTGEPVIFAAEPYPGATRGRAGPSSGWTSGGSRWWWRRDAP